MFKKCLLVSIILHIFVIVGAGLHSPHVSSKITPPVLLLVNTSLTETAGLDGLDGKNGGRGFAVTNQSKPGKPGRATGSPRPVLKTISAVQSPVVETKINSTGVNIEDSVIHPNQVSTQDRLSVSVSGTTAAVDGLGSSGINVDNIRTGDNMDGNGSGTGDGSGTFGQNVLAPLKTHHLEPFYPLAARKNRWEGTVIIEAALGKDGRIGKITLVQSSGYQLLDTEAIKMVKKWHYHPATRDGKPIEWQLRIRILFKLEE